MWAAVHCSMHDTSELYHGISSLYLKNKTAFKYNQNVNRYKDFHIMGSSSNKNQISLPMYKRRSSQDNQLV